ncbi:MAG: hypothetical protein IKF72_03220 [Kiritimatiellae bacterium]|nr:hypothetical protein [Kiritimatiellia bacterium]
MIGLLLALALDVGMLQEAVEVFAPALDVFLAAGERSRAYDEFQREMGREDSQMSLSDAVEVLEILGNRFYFDADGELWYDDRFVRPDEMGAIEAVNRFYRKHFSDASAKARATAPEKKSPAAAVVKPVAVKTPKLPVFRGYEDARYQQYDDLILRMVADFNARRGEWAASTPEQAKLIHDLSPELVKSHMIEETGGCDSKSLAAWKVDPQQVNVPGDWNPYKEQLGLRKPERRNEGTSEQNVRAAVMYLARKGFGVSGQPAANRPEGRFDDWYTALERYNGRSDKVQDGRLYRNVYAERIVRRAYEPKSFVPISIVSRGRSAK